MTLEDAAARYKRLLAEISERHAAAEALEELARQQLAAMPKVEQIRRQEVVGESFRHDDIAELIARRGRCLVARLEHDAAVPGHPNAVRVSLVDGDRLVVCGYLPHDEGRAYLADIQRIDSEGLIVDIPAQVFGGTADKPHLGVWIGTDYSV